MRIAALLAVAAWLLAASARAQDDEMERLKAAVIQVFVVSQPEDYSMPWQRPQPQRSGGSAFFIGGTMFMTNAHVVSDAKNLLVKRADRPERVEARVLFAGHDCDLAVLTVDDERFFHGMRPLDFGGLPKLRSTVAAVGYPVGGTRISITEGVVSRIENRPYAHTRADSHLAVQIDAAINPGNSGGPVLQDGKVVGVAFQGQMFGQNIGYMIPMTVIRHFLDDIADGRYDGYPELGIYDGKLESEALRAYLGVPSGATGIVVLAPTPYASCEGLLRRNDVVHAIDGIPIENDGTIKVDGEFLEYTHVVEGKQVGEKVTLAVRRDGRVVDIVVPLRAWGARMSGRILYDRRAEYLVDGGYVFVPLTMNYLMRRGSEELFYYINQWYATIASPEEKREQLVVLSRVLPHPSTTHRNYNNAVVASVDGTPPRDFRHFAQLIGGGGGGRVKIDFEGVNVPPLVLDRRRIAQAHAAILKSAGIAEDRYVEGE
jgi:S1-C subfamily serine protease